MISADHGLIADADLFSIKILRARLSILCSLAIAGFMKERSYDYFN